MTDTCKRTRTRTFALFAKRFRPIIREDSSLLWDRAEMPPPGLIDSRQWWTVLDCDGTLYLAAGFRFVNRFAYIRCEIPWTGEDRHSGYRYG